MPAQFLPLIKEEFGKEYPAGTSVSLLSTESITPPKKPDVHMSKILSDLVLLIDNRNLYHFECEVGLDKKTVIRMIEYDFHTALTHNLTLDDNEEFEMRFPQSIIIYSGNCIKRSIALHSLTLLRFAPRVTKSSKDYIRLLQYSAERVFRQTPNHQEEVYRMTKSVLILPSDEMEMALAEKDSDLAKQATVIAEQATALAKKDSALAEKDSIILQLQTEIQRLKKEKE